MRAYIFEKNIYYIYIYIYYIARIYIDLQKYAYYADKKNISFALSRIGSKRLEILLEECVTNTSKKKRDLQDELT